LYETVQKEGLVTEKDENTVVVLDTKLTPELLEEGFLREILSKIQNMRKEADFEIQDLITVYYQGSAKITDIFNKYDETIKKEVLAVNITNQVSDDGYTKDWSINGESVTFTVKK
jgi:isoleucyl-tRNA synthetase